MGLGIETSAIRQEEYIMRDIVIVLENIRDLLPDDERDSWNNSFESLLDSIIYTAPEAMGLRWEQLSNMVGMIVGEKPSAPWHFDVIGEIMNIDPQVARDIFGSN